jgi:vacuolar-type H+-ATPase subunit E/Vma4
MLELLRVLRAEPEFFDYALESLRELLDRIEAERKARVRAIRQEAKQEAEGAEGSGRRSAGSSGDEF